MKFFIFPLLLFLFYGVSSLRSKSHLRLDSNIDPFQFLGIPDFKKDLDSAFAKKKPHLASSSPALPPPSFDSSSVKINSLEDLPKYFENGDLNSIQGLKAMTRFLTEDDERLLENGGVYDETGFDGVEPDVVELYKLGSENRDKERAKSAAVLWYKKTNPTTKLEPYSVTLKRDEDLVEWSVYEVIMMCCSGNMEIKRVCISKSEDLALISFVLEKEDRCENRVGIAEEFVNKGLKYVRKVGMKSLAEKFENKRKESFKRLVAERKKQKEQEKLRELEKLKLKQEGKNVKKYKFNEKNDEIKSINNSNSTNQSLNNTPITDATDLESMKSQIELLKQMLASKDSPKSVEAKDSPKAVETTKEEKPKLTENKPDDKDHQGKNLKIPTKEVFSFKEKQENPEDKQVDALKTEVQSLKDDLKDLKEMLKASLLAKSSVNPSESIEKASELPKSS